MAGLCGLSGLSGLTGIAGGIDAANLAYGRIITSWAAPDTAAYQTNKATLIAARLANCNKARATQYYVDATGGSDSNDGLSSGAAFQTSGKIQTVINAIAGSNANVQINWKRGEVFYGTDWATTKNRITFAAYGNSSVAPRLSTFNLQYATGGATWTADGAAWWASEASVVAWAKFRDDALMLSRPFTATASVAACKALADSFFYDSGASRLYVNLNGDNPNSNNRKIEATVGTTTAHQFKLNGDNYYMEGIRWEGYGLSTDGNRATYGAVHVANATGCESYWKNCEWYYTGYHAGCLLHDSSVSGGIATFEGCSAGLCRANAGGCTVFIAHAANGGHECIIKNCTVIAGNLLEASGAGAGRVAQSAFAHSGGPDIALFIVDGLVNTPGPLSVLYSAGTNNTPTASTLSQVRAIIEGERLIQPFTGNAQFNTMRRISVYLAPTYHYQARCHYQGGTDPSTGFGDIGSGWTDTSYFISNSYNVTGVAAYWPCYRTAADNSRIRCCFIEHGNVGTVWPQSTNPSAWVNTRIENSIISLRADYVEKQFSAELSLNVDMTVCLNYNAYFGMNDPPVCTFGVGNGINVANADTHKLVLPGGTGAQDRGVGGAGAVTGNPSYSYVVLAASAGLGSTNRPYLDFNGVAWSGNYMGPIGT